MLTARACWFLVSVLVTLGVGLARPSLPLTLLGLTLLLWFAAQWLWFLIRLPSARRLRLIREVWDDRSIVATLWSGQDFEVRVWLLHDERLPTPHVAAVDFPPFAVERVEGAQGVQGVVTAEEPLEWTYRIRCGAAGRARFEGAHLRLADWQGFFYHVHFVRAPLELPILPMLTPRPGQSAATKRHNMLLPPGIHRFRRPGSGSELLDLRDYLPGDPPKTIAWKVSARRDRLITKEFESEVPVRCTLFVDASSSVRGRTGKALDRLIEVAAAVLHVNTAVRDLTGLYLFDEYGCRGVAPNRGASHRAECLHLLAEAAARMPLRQRVDPEPLLPLAYSFASEVYPELLRPAVNAVPWSLTWTEGFSRYAQGGRRGWFELLHRRKDTLRTLCAWSSFWSLLLPLALLAARVFFRAKSLDGPFLVAVFLCPLAALMLWLATAFLYGVDAATGRSKRRRDHWRKQLAALLSVRHGLAPGGLAALLEDDGAFALHLQRFLNEHQIPYSLPLYTPEGRYAVAAPEKVPVLAEALLRAVGRGRDNELFVLLVDVLELEEALDPLLRAVRVALGRHHRVVLLCPWPPGLELPSSAVAGKPTPQAESRLWDQVTIRRLHLAYRRLRHTFARLGVAVLCAAGDEPVPLILSRLERLRNLGRPHS
jgi:uncharacterized protein (DUF58 family)